MTEAAQRLLFLAELQQGLAKSGERVLVIGIEHQRFFEAAACPGVLFTGVMCVANSYVELHRIRIEAESFSKYVQSFVILSFVIQLMRSFVVLFRTQKRCWHCYAPSEESSISLLYSLDTALFKVVTSTVNTAQVTTATFSEKRCQLPVSSAVSISKITSSNSSSLVKK